MENSQLGTKSKRALEILKRVPGGDKIVAMDEKTPPKVVESKTPVVDKKYVKPNTTDEGFDMNPETSDEAPKSAKTVEPPKTIDTSKEPTEESLPNDFIPDDPDEVDEVIDKKATIKQNFINLRTKLKAKNKEWKSLKEEAETLKKKVTEFETGVAIPEIVEKQNERLAYLEKFEHLYNFEGSPYAQETFIKPLTEEHGKLEELAKGYTNVTPEVLAKIKNAETEAERNKLLINAFGDEVGAFEAKTIIRNIQKIKGEFEKAKNDPSKSLAKYQAENDRILAERRSKANEGIIHGAKTGWSESLLHLREDNRFPEITYREGDTEHNDNYVRPILTKASQEYGRFVRTLAENGLEQLPKEESVALARAFQLAHQAAVVAVERDRLAKENTELRQLIQKRTHLNRPSINGGGDSTGSRPSVPGRVGVGPENAGRNVLARVTGK